MAKYRLGDVAPVSQGSLPNSDQCWLLNLDVVESNTGKVLEYVYVDHSQIGASTVSFDLGNVLYSKLRPYLNKVVLPDRAGYANRMPISSVTDSDVRWFIKDTIADLSLTKKAYKQMQILLKGAFLYAKEEGYTDFSAGTFFFDLVLSDRLFARKAKPDDETQVFNDTEVKMIVDHLWKEQDIRGLGLILMFQTGMRVGELAALRRESIKDGCIRISATEETYADPETGKKICEVVDHAKTDAGERTIILPDGAERTLKAIRALNPFGEFLFMDKHGDRIRSKRFNTWLHRTCKKLGIPERSTHKIRKTYASILLSNRVDERLVTLQMGHTDILTTKGIYYYNRKNAEESRQVISGVINF